MFLLLSIPILNDSIWKERVKEEKKKNEKDWTGIAHANECIMVVGFFSTE